MHGARRQPRYPPLKLPKGAIALPDGGWVNEEYFPNYVVDERAGDFEYEADQDPFDDVTEILPDYLVFSQSVNAGSWDDAADALPRLYSLVGELSRDLRRSQKNIDAIFEDIELVLTFLASAEFSPIWVPSEKQVLEPEVFLEVDRRIAEGIVAKPAVLDSVDPRFFEELMATIFSKMGFDVFLTKRTRDGGRDIVAVGSKANLLLKFIIECKRYAKHRRVSVAQVRELFGVKASEGASKAILATTSTFSREAKEFAAKHMWELQLLDHSEVLSMLRRYVTNS